jgi:hypothetical protein
MFSADSDKGDTHARTGPCPPHLQDEELLAMKKRPQLRDSPLRLALLTAASVLLSVASCSGQMLDFSPRLIQGVLARAHVSGSISYWSPERCPSPSMPYPVFPEVRVIDHSGPPRELLLEMFAGDPKMHVTQEPGGLIRMSEAGISTDLLDVRIHHIEFSDYGHAENVTPGAYTALHKIVSSPEVQAFKKSHNIEVFDFRTPSSINFLPRAWGELDDVTVSQALDYVLRIFPGYWIYGNCMNKEGGREVFFHFFANAP